MANKKTIAMVAVVCLVILAASVGSYMYFSLQPAHKVATVRFLCSEWADAPEQAFGEAMVNLFNDQHPYIKISPEYATWDSILTKLTAGLEAGQPPDLVWTGVGGISTMVQLDAILPVTDLIQEFRSIDFGKDDYTPGSRIVINGEDMIVPIEREPMLLYYRRDLFEAKGIQTPIRTFDELLDAAEKLTEDTNGDGEIDRWGIALSLSRSNKISEDFWSFIMQAGSIFSNDGKTVVWNTTKAGEIFKFWKDLAQYSPPASVGYAYSEVRQAFKTEKVAMHFYQGRTLGEIWASYPNLVNKTGVQEIPAINSADFPAPSYDCDEGFMIVKQSTHIEAAKEFIRFFVNDKEKLIKYLLTVPYHEIPTTNSLLNDPSFFDHPLGEARPDIVQKELAIVQKALAPIYQYPGDSPKVVLRAVIDRYILTDAVQQYIVGGKSLDQVLETAHAALVNLASEYS